MNKILLAILFLVTTGSAFAQNTEISMGLQGGLMHFSGSASKSSTSINEGLYNYSTLPYGNKNGFGYSAFLQGQQLINNKFIVGLQVGFDLLKSKAAVTQVNTLANPFPVNATGSSSFTGRYVNANPFAGIRFPFSNLKVDVLAGLEIAYVTSAYDEGEANFYNGTIIKTNDPVKTINIDNRIKTGVVVHYERVGIALNYAHGLSNYAKGSGTAHTEILRFGVSLNIF